jgi:hypothetical protein
LAQVDTWLRAARLIIIDPIPIWTTSRQEHAGSCQGPRRVPAPPGGLGQLPEPPGQPPADAGFDGRSGHCNDEGPNEQWR